MGRLGNEKGLDFVHKNSETNMQKLAFLFFGLILLALASCEEEKEELMLDDFVNQEYEAQKNRFFAATINFRDFEAKEVELDSFNGQWIIWAHNSQKQLKIFLPYLRVQKYVANDSNGVEMRYKESGGEWYHSSWAKNNPFFVFEINRFDTSANQLFGKFEGTLFNESQQEELFVDRGVFNRLQYPIE